jgi:hypothetical protein
MPRQVAQGAALLGFGQGRDTTTEDPSSGASEATTYVTFATGFGGGEGITAEYLSELGLPITTITAETACISPTISPSPPQASIGMRASQGAEHRCDRAVGQRTFDDDGILYPYE